MAGFLVALAALACLLCAGVRGDAVVRTIYGPVRGVVVSKGERFLGVPFARPPTNELRWQPPLPPRSWHDIRDAFVFGPDCPSTHSDYVKYVQSEDCLYLNVYRPNNLTADSKLPVLLFLYGGSWEFGGSSFIVYQGDNIVQYANVIVVTTNYRLGALGFLGSAEFAARTGDHSTGNYGLQDQRAAMVWVQDNIAAFGGDPKRVFLFGESAGSGSVAAHMVLPRSRGLFTFAGMESGPPADWSSRPLNASQFIFNTVAASLKCTGADVANCMVKTDVKDLLKVQDEASDGLLAWAPVVDGVELTDEPQLLWKAGKLNPASAILLGTNTDEGSIFIKNISHTASPADFTAWIMQRFGPTFGAKVLAQYPVTDYASPWFAASTVFTDSFMACPTRRAARWATNVSIPAYLYQFVHQLEALTKTSPFDGVAHASEVPLVFYASELLWTAPERLLSRQFISYWTSFAHGGNPNTDGSWPTVAWPVFDASSGAYLRLDLTPSPQTHLKDTVCDFWDKVFDAGCNMEHCPCDCPV